MRKLIYAGLVLALAGLLSPYQQTRAQAQKNAVEQVMMAKLQNSQRLLAGIALADYPKIRQSAENLIQLSKTAEWLVIQTPRYEMHSNEFRRAAETVVRKAKEKNIDGVTLAYMDLTLSCVRCHEYVREVRDVRLRPAPSGIEIVGIRK